MKKRIVIGLSAAALLLMSSMTAFAEGAIKTQDGLLEIELPEGNWYQITSAENTEMFSNGDCAIMVNLYKNGDTLPAIQSADENHEMIYTAAASTLDYVLHVVGYANKQSDFSGICKAINTIKVDDTKITDSMLDHAIAMEKYGIADMNYTAWVAADELNVRSTSENGSIITTLYLGDKVTVTGSVLKNGVEIGWSRIKTADGTEGYVSAQFLSETATGKAEPETDQKAEKTSTIIKLYDSASNEYYFTVYTDGTARSDKGTIYWKDANGNYIDGNGTILYTYAPSTGIYRTGNIRTVYNDYGTAFTIYEYSDGNYYDDAFNVYTVSLESDTMAVNGGQWYVYSGDPTIGTETSVDEDFDVFQVADDYGNVVIIGYNSTVGAYVDYNGNIYYRYNPWGAYMSENGIMYHAV